MKYLLQKNEHVSNEFGNKLTKCNDHGMHTPPPPSARGVEPPTKFGKKEGLTGSQFLEGVAGKEGETFFRGLQFSHKN